MLSLLYEADILAAGHSCVLGAANWLQFAAESIRSRVK